MPQLDPYLVFSEIFWFSIFFSITYLAAYYAIKVLHMGTTLRNILALPRDEEANRVNQEKAFVAGKLRPALGRIYLDTRRLEDDVAAFSGALKWKRERFGKVPDQGFDAKTRAALYWSHLAQTVERAMYPEALSSRWFSGQEMLMPALQEVSEAKVVNQIVLAKRLYPDYLHRIGCEERDETSIWRIFGLAWVDHRGRESKPVSAVPRKPTPVPPFIGAVAFAGTNLANFSGRGPEAGLARIIFEKR